VKLFINKKDVLNSVWCWDKVQVVFYYSQIHQNFLKLFFVLLSNFFNFEKAKVKKSFICLILEKKEVQKVFW
jgi:hypothetical protein